MTRELRVVQADDTPNLLVALRSALAGDGPAVLPRAADAPALPRAAHAPAEQSPSLQPPTHVAQNIALVIETSGSTGTPKRVALSADALLASAAASEGALPGNGGPDQGQWLLCLPGHYIAGANVLIRSIVAQTDPVIMAPGHFDPGAFRDTAATMTGDGRYVSLVPVQLARLIDAAAGDGALLTLLRRFDAILVGGQALAPHLAERAANLGLAIVRTYGSSETGGGCVYNGYPIGTVRAREREGLIELGGPVLADGYLDDGYLLDPDRTDSAFHVDEGIRWYRTGDLGGVAADGSVTVTGRSDNVIISGGEKVLLDAVERRVRELDWLHDAVVVAAASTEWGQVPVVVATVDDPARADLAGLRAHVAAALGRAAAPARIVTIERMPHLASGKPDRVALARIASDS
jgi:O-succinylbenzoic acid--CoA ligase